MAVKLDDLEWAVEFASSGIGEHEAYINLDTGETYYVGDVVEEPIPDDLYENERYLQIPSKRELDLSKRLALNFIAKSMPDKLTIATDIFSSRGAYPKFKVLLESSGQLVNWYSYEEAELKKAIIKWCRDNDIDCSNGI
jgi:hypothetical protein